MEIPYIKTHGARNDFLITVGLDFEPAERPAIARAICERHTGVGADGWILLSDGGPGSHGAIELWNSDGSRSEISGNGTRCAAAVLVDSGKATRDVAIATGAGVKNLKLLIRDQFVFSFEMNMGRPHIEELHSTIAAPYDATILNVGNPQCAVFVPNFDFDWVTMGATLERHPRFPNRTNVSFIRVVDRQSLEVRFFERGAGKTLSSGTGSTGSAASARARGLIEDSVTVITPAGPLQLRWAADDILLAGPAEITARGVYYHRE